MLYTPTLRGPHAIVRAVISLLNIPGNSVRTGTHQTVEWSPSGYDRFGGEGGPAALIWDYDSRTAGGAPEAKGYRSQEGGRRRWARGIPEWEGPDSRLGNTTSGVTPRRTRVLARHLQIGCRGTGTRGNHPRIRRRHLTQQENDRVAHSNTNKQTNKQTNQWLISATGVDLLSS